jgi:hypothetical protein
MKGCLPGGRYTTPAGVPVAPLYRLLGGWRCADRVQYFSVALAARQGGRGLIVTLLLQVIMPQEREHRCFR